MPLSIFSQADTARIGLEKNGIPRLQFKATVRIGKTGAVSPGIAIGLPICQPIAAVLSFLCFSLTFSWGMSASGCTGRKNLQSHLYQQIGSGRATDGNRIQLRVGCHLAGLFPSKEPCVTCNCMSYLTVGPIGTESLMLKACSLRSCNVCHKLSETLLLHCSLLQPVT